MWSAKEQLPLKALTMRWRVLLFNAPYLSPVNSSIMPSWADNTHTNNMWYHLPCHSYAVLFKHGVYLKIASILIRNMSHETNLKKQIISCFHSSLLMSNQKDTETKLHPHMFHETSFHYCPHVHRARICLINFPVMVDFPLGTCQKSPTKQ